MGDIFNQHHSGSGDNVINFGKKPFELSDQQLTDMAAKIDRFTPVDFDLVGQEAIYYGDRLRNLLANRGYTIGSFAATMMRSSMVFPPPPPTQNPRRVDISVVAGSTLVFLDSNA